MCRQYRRFLDCVADNFLMLLEGRDRNNSLLDLLLTKREEQVANMMTNNSWDQSDYELVQFMIQRKSGKTVSKF